MKEFKNSHSVAVLGYQIVLVTYKRNKWLNDYNLPIFIKAAKTVAAKHDVIIVKAQHDTIQQDHIHLAINANVTSDLVKFINSLKSCSSRLLKINIQNFKWSSGYWIGTYGNCDEKSIQDYIDDQKNESHQKKYSHRK